MEINTTLQTAKNRQHYENLQIEWERTDRQLQAARAAMCYSRLPNSFRIRAAKQVADLFVTWLWLKEQIGK